MAVMTIEYIVIQRKSLDRHVGSQITLQKEEEEADTLKIVSTSMEIQCYDFRSPSCCHLDSDEHNWHRELSAIQLWLPMAKHGNLLLCKSKMRTFLKETNDFIPPRGY